MITRKFCPKCGRPVVKSLIKGYAFQCKSCDEDFYRFEILTTRQITTVRFIRRQANLMPIANGVYLCRCNNCNSYLIDHNPQTGAKTYCPQIAEGQLKQFADMSNNKISHDINYFWGCPNCRTDYFLTDL